jgi:hypothetical protein
MPIAIAREGKDADMDRANLPIRKRLRLYRCAGHRRREYQSHEPDAARMADTAVVSSTARSPREPVEVHIRQAGRMDRDNS